MSDSPEVRASTQMSRTYMLDNVPDEDLPPGAGRSWMMKAKFHMFVEDVAEGLIPFSACRGGPESLVSIEGGDSRGEVLLNDALRRFSRHDYGRAGLSENVADFVRHIGHSVVSIGEAYVELAFIGPGGGGAFDGFEVIPIPPGSVVRRWWRVQQLIPASVTGGAVEKVELDRDRVFRFEAHQPFNRHLKRITEDLALISDNLLPDFAMPGASDEPVPFDSAQHFYRENVAVARCSRSTGWTARGLFSERTLEHYDLTRMLRFERFKIQLRDVIIRRLNDVVARAGKELPGLGRVVLNGVPSESDVDLAEEKLARGGCPFSEVMKAFLRP